MHSEKCTQIHSLDASHSTLSRCAQHISSVGTSHWLKVQKVRVIHIAPHSSCLLMSLLNVPYRPFPRMLSSPSAPSSRPQRLPQPWQEVGATAQARPLAGVSLAEWLTQHQTQVMSPSSPTSSATRIWSTIRSISPKTTSFPVHRRRHNDFRQCKRCAEFRSIQQQPKKSR